MLEWLAVVGVAIAALAGLALARLRADLRALARGFEAQGEAHSDARHALSAQLEEARRALERVEAEARVRAERAAVQEAMLGRIEAVMAGSHARGAAGELALGALLRQLPPELLERDVRLDGGVVEFALRLPDGKLLPVDAKWPAAPKLQRLAEASPEERARLVAAVQRDVEAKAAEAARYLEPARTCGMAVVALPDAVHALCDRAHVQALRRGVVLVPFGMAVPYLLAVWHLAHRMGPGPEDARLAEAVREALAALDEVAREVEGRMARAATMLEHSRRALQANAARAEQALRQAQVQAQAQEVAPTSAPR